MRRGGSPCDRGTRRRSKNERSKAEAAEQKQAAAQERQQEKARLAQDRASVADLTKLQGQTVKEQDELRVQAEEEVRRCWRRHLAGQRGA